MKDEGRKRGGKLTALRRKNLLRAATDFSRVAAKKEQEKKGLLLVNGGLRVGVLPSLVRSCYPLASVFCDGQLLFPWRSCRLHSGSRCGDWLP